MEADMVKNDREFLSGAAPIPWRSQLVKDAVTGRKLDGPPFEKRLKPLWNKAIHCRETPIKIDLFKGVIEEELDAVRRNHE
jgi:hypothetical protein